LGFLRYDVTNLAYAIPDLKTGAVIGVGAVGTSCRNASSA
jgi:hypothetical protein